MSVEYGLHDDIWGFLAELYRKHGKGRECPLCTLRRLVRTKKISVHDVRNSVRGMGPKGVESLRIFLCSSTRKTVPASALAIAMEVAEDDHFHND